MQLVILETWDALPGDKVLLLNCLFKGASKDASVEKKGALEDMDYLLVSSLTRYHTRTLWYVWRFKGQLITLHLLIRLLSYFVGCFNFIDRWV